MTLEGERGFPQRGDALNCLKQADLVVTNPPFSLFREYVAQLVEYCKTVPDHWQQECNHLQGDCSLLIKAQQKCGLAHGFNKRGYGIFQGGGPLNAMKTSRTSNRSDRELVNKFR